MADTPRAVVIYCRISQDRAGAGIGVARQEKECRALADRLGWTVIEVYVDNDLSAYSGKPRPAYRRMLEQLRDGTATAVIAWHTDRLHRSPVELEEYIAICEPAGVPTMTVAAGPVDLASPSGRAVARTLGAWARFESEHKSHRMKAAREQAAVAGRWQGGRRPYGFGPDGVTVVPAEAAVIVEATNALLAGASVRGIADDLNRRGIPTTTGKRWLSTTVRHVMMRARNAGLREHRGEIVGPAAWDAIVPEETWRAMVSVLTDESRYQRLPGPRRWLGSGMYRCGVCDERMWTSSGGRDRRSTGYTCSGHVYRQAETLDEYVAALVVERLSREDATEVLSPPTPGVDVAGLRSESVVLRRRLDELAQLYSEGVVDLRQLRTGSTSARARLEEIEAALARASVTSPVTGLVGAADVAAVWRGLDLSRRRAVLDALMTVIVDPAPKGKPKGWRPGQPYFHPSAVRIRWRQAAR